ncbi:MAG: hydrogenase 4 subunit F [Clostridia bacterium]|nr:hydrogenase 4 subunit F [Clostridia bacterium]
MEILFLAIPFVAAGLFWLTNHKRTLHWINAISAAVLFSAAFWFTYRAVVSGSYSFSFFNNLFYIDSLSLILLDTTITISFMVSIYSIKYLDEELENNMLDIKKLKLYYSLTYIFIFTMVLVLVTPNLGVMWIAIEATTLASAFLVGFHNNKNSIEAAWKYIIICSVGIAFALLGIILLHFSSIHILHGTKLELNWLFLSEHANGLQSSVLKISFIFVLVGFGTKAGLVPMHTWLPDAHSQAPSPISALLSGVLLNTAMYGIIRILSIVNKNLGNSTYTGTLLMAIGILSVAAAAIFILPQKDYKRLLAYSSIEHMGIIAFALGVFTPAAVFAALFHMVNHSFTKSMLFLSSGNVFLKYNSRETSKVTGILKTLPVTGLVFFLGLFAIAGSPPFSVFSSEIGIILSAFADSHYLPGSLFILLITMVFIGIVIALSKMFLGNNENKAISKGEINIPGTAVIVVLFILIVTMGIIMPKELKEMLASASSLIRGGN